MMGTVISTDERKTVLESKGDEFELTMTTVALDEETEDKLLVALRLIEVIIQDYTGVVI